MGSGVPGLRREAERLIDRVAHWGPPRWAAPASAGGASRAEVVHALVQRIADLVAAVEGRPRRAVPRLDNDLALPDQLRVMVADLGAAGAGPDVVETAVAAVARTRDAL
jgi:hypothetical protein